MYLSSFSPRKKHDKNPEVRNLFRFGGRKDDTRGVSTTWVFCGWRRSRRLSDKGRSLHGETEGRDEEDRGEGGCEKSSGTSGSEIPRREREREGKRFFMESRGQFIEPKM